MGDTVTCTGTQTTGGGHWALEFHTTIEGEPMDENDEQETTPTEKLADDVETAARLIQDWLPFFVVCAVVSTVLLFVIALNGCQGVS